MLRKNSVYTSVNLRSHVGPLMRAIATMTPRARPVTIDVIAKRIVLPIPTKTHGIHSRAISHCQLYPIAYSTLSLL